MDWLHYLGQISREDGSLERKEFSMADPDHPRCFTEDLKRQIVELCNDGKSVAEIIAEYDLSRSTDTRCAPIS